MPKQVKVSEIEEILSVIKKASYGASMEEIASQLSFSLPRIGLFQQSMRRGI